MAGWMGQTLLASFFPSLALSRLSLACSLLLLLLYLIIDNNNKAVENVENYQNRRSRGESFQQVLLKNCLKVFNRKSFQQKTTGF